jgi:hypothetical protein
MDNSYYEELAGRLYGLVIRLGDRLPAGQARWLHHVIDAGEYGLALEDFAAAGSGNNGQSAVLYPQSAASTAVVLAGPGPSAGDGGQFSWLAVPSSICAFRHVRRSDGLKAACVLLRGRLQAVLYRVGAVRGVGRLVRGFAEQGWRRRAP